MENSCQLIILYPEKMFQKPMLNKDWSDILKLKKLGTNIFLLHRRNSQAWGKWYNGNVDLHIGLRCIGQGQYVNKCKTLKNCFNLFKRKWSLRAKITMYVGLYNIKQNIWQQYYKD